MTNMLRGDINTFANLFNGDLKIHFKKIRDYEPCNRAPPVVDDLARKTRASNPAPQHKKLTATVKASKTLVQGADVYVAGSRGMDAYTRTQLSTALSKLLSIEETDFFIEVLLQTEINKLCILNAPPITTKNATRALLEFLRLAQQPASPHLEKLKEKHAVWRSSQEKSTPVQDEGEWTPEKLAKLVEAAEVLLKKSSQYPLHSKGLGVFCLRAEGLSSQIFIEEYLGEAYPLWRWFEKEENLKVLRKKLMMKERQPNFYNMLLERYSHDEAGNNFVMVDPSKKGNFTSRISHSCSPNLKVKNICHEGQYRLVVKSIRPIAQYEELSFDYCCRSDSMEEVKKAICLCGSKNCRGSYLTYFDDSFSDYFLLNFHPLRDRFSLLVQATALAQEVSRSRPLQTHFRVANNDPLQGDPGESDGEALLNSILHNTRKSEKKEHGSSNDSPLSQEGEQAESQEADSANQSPLVGPEEARVAAWVEVIEANLKSAGFGESLMGRCPLWLRFYVGLILNYIKKSSQQLDEKVKEYRKNHAIPDEGDIEDERILFNGDRESIEEKYTHSCLAFVDRVLYFLRNQPSSELRTNSPIVRLTLDERLKYFASLLQTTAKEVEQCFDKKTSAPMEERLATLQRILSEKLEERDAEKAQGFGEFGDSEGYPRELGFGQSELFDEYPGDSENGEETAPGRSGSSDCYFQEIQGGTEGGSSNQYRFADAFEAKFLKELKSLCKLLVNARPKKKKNFVFLADNLWLYGCSHYLYKYTEYRSFISEFAEVGVIKGKGMKDLVVHKEYSSNFLLVYCMYWFKDSTELNKDFFDFYKKGILELPAFKIQEEQEGTHNQEYPLFRKELFNFITEQREWQFFPSFEFEVKSILGSPGLDLAIKKRLFPDDLKCKDKLEFCVKGLKEFEEK